MGLEGRDQTQHIERKRGGKGRARQGGQKAGGGPGSAAPRSGRGPVSAWLLLQSTCTSWAGPLHHWKKYLKVALPATRTAATASTVMAVVAAAATPSPLPVSASARPGGWVGGARTVSCVQGEASQRPAGQPSARGCSAWLAPLLARPPRLHSHFAHQARGSPGAAGLPSTYTLGSSPYTLLFSREVSEPPRVVGAPPAVLPARGSAEARSGGGEGSERP